jgi:hypothetical protein
LIAEDKDALSMIRKVTEGHRYLMLYLDHERERSNVMHWDDVIANQVTNLPPVISPMKKSINVHNEIAEVNVEKAIGGAAVVHAARRERRESMPDIVDNMDSDNSSDSDYVPDIVESIPDFLLDAGCGDLGWSSNNE